MREMLIGAVGLIVLAAIFLLVGRQQDSRPKGSCGGCALASVCEKRVGGEAAEREDRQECYVGEERPPEG